MSSKRWEVGGEQRVEVAGLEAKVLVMESDTRYQKVQ